MTITNTIDEFTGTSPNRSQPAEDFETNVGDFLPWMEGLAVDLNTTIGEINSTVAGINSDIATATNAANTATSQADLAEEWATSTTIVEATDYSAKEYAIGATAPLGSSKSWATSTTEVSGGFKGARGYAEDAFVSANSAAASAASAGVDFTATSTTSALINTGSKTFAIETGKAFIEGQSLRIVSDANVNNYMIGQITNAVDGSVTVNVTAIGGSGTFADWRISLFEVNQSELDLKADSNNAVLTGSITEETYVLTGSVLDPLNGTIQYANLTGNVTYTESLTEGQNLTLVFDGGATYVVTLPAVTWITTGGNVAPTFNGTKDAIVLWKQQGVLYGAYTGNAGGI